MLNYEQIERNKNTIINIAIIILAVIIALQLYRSANDQVSLLIQQQAGEMEKNKVFEDIAVLEKKTETYKKVFVKKDLASVMDVIYGIAKNASVKILSVKPVAEESMVNYFKSSFLITLTSPSYNNLGEFISKIENNKDIYMVSEVSVSAAPANPDVVAANVDLNVSLKINILSYL